LVTAKIRERKPEITLAGVTGIVHGDKLVPRGFSYYGAP
jgi:hypothetical protein